MKLGTKNLSRTSTLLAEEKCTISEPPFREAFSAPLAESLLEQCPWGHPIHHHRLVESTQIIAKEMAVKGAKEGLIVIADEQTSGRGRQGRQWNSQSEGNIYASFLLRPDIPQHSVQLLSFAAGLAVQKMLFESFDIQASIKWPNDVLVEGKKLCGILCESAGDSKRVYHAIIGIGINVNQDATAFPKDIEAIATSIRSLIGHTVSRTYVLALLTQNLYNSCNLLLKNQDKEYFLEYYTKNCATIGSKVKVISDNGEFLGTAESVTPQGALMVVAPNGQRRQFSAADVIHLRSDK